MQITVCTNLNVIIQTMLVIYCVQEKNLLKLPSASIVFRNCLLKGLYYLHCYQSPSTLFRSSMCLSWMSFLCCIDPFQILLFVIHAPRLFPHLAAIQRAKCSLIFPVSLFFSFWFCFAAAAAEGKHNYMSRTNLFCF